MSLQNINRSPEYIKHIVASRIFESSPLVVVDVGARGGFEDFWSVYHSQIKSVGFEVDIKECDKLNKRSSKTGNRFFPFALHQDRGRRTFYITAHPGSSSFYLPDTNYCQRFVNARANLSVVKTVSMDTIGFDSFANENGINNVDFMKIDTEGCELDILKGAIGTLKKSVVGLSIEVEFCPIHNGQPLFSDVDLFLRPLGFKLFDMALYRLVKKVSSQRDFAPFTGSDEQGQVVCGQALYLRDGVSEIESQILLEDGWDDMKILKLASIMELFRLPDCAIELIQVSHRKGFLQNIDVGHIIDLLARSVAKKKVVVGRTKQLSIRFLPHCVSLKAYNFLVKLRDLINEILNI